jgi:hypothetical protein
MFSSLNIFKQNSGSSSPLFAFFAIMKKIKITLAALLILMSVILPHTQTKSAESSNVSKVFSENEKLVYDVSYGGISLGTIRINSQNYDNENNAVKVIAFLESHKNIPFVSLKAKFESSMDPNLSHTKMFIGNTYMSPGGSTYEKIYTFGENIIAERWVNKKFDARDTNLLSRKINDGMSLFFSARENSGSGKKITAPVFVANKVKPTEMIF